MSLDKIYIGSFETLSLKPIQCVTTEAYRFLLIFRHNQFYAFDHACPHKYASLCDAEISNDEIVCPWHGARFNITTGLCQGPLAISGIKCWPVLVEQKRVFIRINPEIAV